MVGLAAPAQTPRYVAPAGSDAAAGTAAAPWRTLSHAVTNAVTQSGDAIFAAVGLYEENPAIPADRMLSLHGGYDAGSWERESGGWSVVRAAEPSADVLTCAAKAGTFSGLVLTGGRCGLAVPTISSALGSGIYEVDRCIVTNNASHGVYVNSWRSALRLRNALVARNGGDGVRTNVDGPQCAYGHLVDSCTVAYNGGSGLYAQCANPEMMAVTNSIVAGNGAYAFGSAGASVLDCTVWHSLVCSNAAGVFQSSLGGPWDGFLTAEPRFRDPEGNDFRLLEGSPAVGAGGAIPAGSGREDLEGNPRSGVLDMGCYQSGFPAVRHATLYVNAETGNDANDGTTPAAAKRTLAEALAFVAENGRVAVAPGDYEETLAFIPVANVTLAGAGPDLTRLFGRRGTAGCGVINLASTNTTVEGVSVSGGDTGILVLGKGPGEGTPMFKGIVSNCVVQVNGKGFAVRKTFARQKQYVVATHCRIVANDGAGVSSDQVTGPQVRNCLIVSNGADGVYFPLDQSAPAGFVDHCTIANNKRHGICLEGANPIHLRVRNTILADNAGWGWTRTGTPAQLAALEGVVIHGNGSGSITDKGTRFIVRNILIEPPAFVAAGDHHLAPQSPAVGVGSDLGIGADLDGIPRAGRFDSGCFQAAADAGGVVRFAEVYVDARHGDDGNDGLSPGAAKATVAEGLRLTDAGGVCRIAPGLYEEADNLLIVRDNMRLIGAGSDVTRIVGAPSVNAVLTDAATNTLVSGLTLSGASYGLYCARSGRNRGTVEQCVIVSNTVGVYLYEGSADGRVYPHLRLSRCRVRFNASHGVHALDTSTVLLENCLVAENGGIGVNLPIDQIAQSPCRIDFCTIAHNGGHGVAWSSSYPGSLAIRSSIVADNVGTGVYRQKAAVYNGHSVEHSLVYGNAPDFFNAAYMTFDAGAITNRLALLRADYRLSPLSPAVNTALDLGVTLDLDGEQRPRQGGYDMGAHEFYQPGSVLLFR